MGKIKENLTDEVEDLYWEHSQHDTYQEGCSTCWVENLITEKTYG